MKIRILHVTQFLGIGGLEKVLLMLMIEQIKAGHTVKLIVYDYEQAWVEEFRNAGLEVDTSYSKKPGYDKGLISFLQDKIEGYDVIHTHDLNPLMYVIPLKLISKFKFQNFPRLVHTAHGMDHLKTVPKTRFYERVCAEFTDATIGVSEEVCEQYIKLGVPKNQVININNGTIVPEHDDVDKTHFKSKIANEFGLDPEKPLWGAVARVVPLKNQKLLCELARCFPHLNILLIGPSGDEKYWRELKSTKPTNIIMTGGRSDIKELLQGLDLFISASTHEGIPISVLEAGAMSLPCLLSDIPGHRLIQEGASDQVVSLFKSNELKDLVEKSSLILNREMDCKKMGESFYHHVKAKYSSYTMSQRYQEVYLG